MTERRYKERKQHLAKMLNAVKSNKKKPDKETIRFRKLVNSIAKRLNVSISAIIPETIMDMMCCETHFPKVKFPTLAKAKSVTGGKPYPCPSCDNWHGTTTCVPKIPETFTCPGCNLAYVKRNPEQLYCCKGCRKKHVHG